MPASTMMTLGPAAAAREPCCATVSAARSNAAANTRALDVEELIFSNQCDMYYQCTDLQSGVDGFCDSSSRTDARDE